MTEHFLEHGTPAEILDVVNRSGDRELLAPVAAVLRAVLPASTPPTS